MKAVVVWTHPLDGSEQIEVSGHGLQMGGNGDGYCYVHQSFDCIDTLTQAEWVAITNATPGVSDVD